MVARTEAELPLTSGRSLVSFVPLAFAAYFLLSAGAQSLVYDVSVLGTTGIMFHEHQQQPRNASRHAPRERRRHLPGQPPTRIGPKS